MRELPKASSVKFETKKLIPDGNRKKPPLSLSSNQSAGVLTAGSVSTNGNGTSTRESITSDVSSSRPNSTASEGGASTDDDDINATTECSESCQDTSSDEEGNKGALEPISEEASLRKQSEEEEHGCFIFRLAIYKRRCERFS